MLEFKHEESLNNEIIALDKKLRMFSAIRLVIGIALIVFLISLFSIGSITFVILSIVSFLAFILFVIFTNKYYHEAEHLKKKQLVYTLHKKRRALEYASFYDTGSEFIERDDYKESDLDIFGKKSLYQYLCSAKTKLGRLKLKEALTAPKKRELKFTKCVDELTHHEEILDVEADILEFSADAKHLDYDEFLSLLGKKIEFKPIFILPILSFLATIIYLILVLAINLNPYILIVFIMLNLFTVRTLNNEAFMLNSTSYHNICDSYINVSKSILNINIDDEYFKELENDIKEELPNLYKIKGIYSTLSCRRNIIFSLILNSLCIVDFWILLRYNAINKTTLRLAELFDSVAEVELMISLANLGIDNEVYSIPKEGNEVKGVNMYHPLVKGCVPNSIELNGGIILTGSNMSGKTTFMRTLGINEILFNAGGIVPAESFTAPHMEVLTSLRANDMLSEGVSTFYAEILRMKKVNSEIENGRCLVLIDEIFKGTNAYERITASMKVIEKLNSKNTIFIISTHDFELCEAKNIINYHFSEYYEDEKIYFDYKLKDGKCESKNALYLLRMANII